MKRARLEALVSALESNLTGRQVAELAAWSLITRGDAFLQKMEDRTQGAEEWVSSAWSVLRDWKEGKANAAQPSGSKLLESWSALRVLWLRRVEAGGDEDGGYCCQERHWEPPFLDHGQWMGDLDEVARGLRPLLDEVFALDPDAAPFDFDAIEEARSSLPEYVGEMEDDPPELGSEVSRVALRWEWLRSRSDAAAFVGTVADATEAFAGCPLAQSGLDAFVEELDEPERRRLLTALNAAGPGPPWERILLRLARELDQEAWLAACGAGLDRDWELGFPLLQRASEQGQWAEATAWPSACWRAAVGTARHGWTSAFCCGTTNGRTSPSASAS